MSSKFLNPLALKGLNKIGDIFIPESDGLPSFSQLGCSDFIDRVIADLPASDRDGLNILFSLFYILPKFLLIGLFNFLEWIGNRPVPAGFILRQIRIGVRGIVFSLYYSGWKSDRFTGQAPLEVLDYKLTVIRD